MGRLNAADAGDPASVVDAVIVGIAGCSAALEGPKVYAAAKAADGESGKLPMRTKLMLGVGEAVQGIYITIGGYFLNSFLLETACINPMYVATMQAIQGVFDALNDPLIGSLSDRTRTRWGRRRPWLLFAAPALALFYFGLWNALPVETPQIWKFVYALFAYMGVSVGITSIQVQIGALVPELTDNYDERTSVSGWRIAMMSIIGLAAAICHSSLVSGSLEPASSYRLSGAILAIVMWASSWTTFAGIREKWVAQEESQERLPLLESLRTILRNKAFLYVSGAYLCGPTAVVLIQSNFYMFSKYILGDPDLLSILMSCAQGFGMLFLPVWVLMSTRFDKRFVFMVGGTGFLLALTAIFFVQSANQAVILACMCGSCVSTVYLVPYSLLPDVVDEDELRTGKRREGLFVGFFTTALKFSATSALTLTNLMLKAFGYTAPVATCGAEFSEKVDTLEEHAQTHEVLLCIRMLCSLVPALFMLVAIMCVWCFPITRRIQVENARLVALRRHKRATELAANPDPSDAPNPNDVMRSTATSEEPAADEMPADSADSRPQQPDRAMPPCASDGASAYTWVEAAL